jgi:hypothetical protein
MLTQNPMTFLWSSNGKSEGFCTAIKNVCLRSEHSGGIALVKALFRHGTRRVSDRLAVNKGLIEGMQRPCRACEIDPRGVELKQGVDEIFSGSRDCTQSIGELEIADFYAFLSV